MPTTLQAIPATSLIQEKYPQSYRTSGDMEAITEAQRLRGVLGFDIDKTKQRVPKILAAFQEHEFWLYRPSDVDLYKDQQARREKFHAERRQHLWRASKVLSVAIATAMWVCCSAIAAYDVAGGSVTTPYWSFAVCGAIMTSIIALSCLWGEEESMYTTGEVTASWKNYPLKDFPDQIPLAALRQMEKIRLAIPNAVFTVSKLELHIKEVQRGRFEWLDPILYVKMKGEKFALPVAVWDEPDFDGKPFLASAEPL